VVQCATDCPYHNLQFLELMNPRGKTRNIRSCLSYNTATECVGFDKGGIVNISVLDELMVWEMGRFAADIIASLK
jgi:hypothetical protein